MGKEPFLTLVMIGIGTLQNELPVDKEEWEDFRALGLKERLDLGVLHESHRLLREIEALHGDTVFLQLMKESRHLGQDRVDVRSADS